MLKLEPLKAEVVREQDKVEMLKRMCQSSGTHLGEAALSGIDFWALDGKLIGFYLKDAIRYGDYHEMCNRYRDRLGRLPWAHQLQPQASTP